MSEQPPDSHPNRPSDPEPPAGNEATQSIPADPGPAGEPRSRWRRIQDRVWSFRAVLAVALASLIVGGLGGAAIAGLTGDDDGRGGGHGRFERGDADGRKDGRRGHRDFGHRDFGRRGQGQGQWGQDGPPGVPSPTPSPAQPTPSS